MNTPGETFREEITNLLTDLEAALLELEDHPNDTDSVDTAFRAIHTIKVAGGIFGFHKISEFTHHLTNAFDLVRSGELVVTKQLINIALGSGDHIRSLLYEFDSRSGLDAEGRALMDQFGTLLSPGIAEVVAADKPRETADHNSQPNAAHRIRQAPAVDEGSGNLKVPTSRLNILMDLVGRLVTAQARLNQSANTLADADLTNVAEEIERLTAELRDNTLAIRMMPIGTTFARFRRLVRPPRRSR
jgi:two-component system chemotaxis sensor kinase CheA